MATSRKRERELARRRFERRRQLELERRARQKRRNTILGSTLGTAVVIAVVIVLIVHFAGGSSPKNAAATTTPTPTPSTSATTAAPARCAKINPNPPAKGQPRIPDVTGKDPKKLVVKDIKVGHGRAAKDGDSLAVTYIGVACSTGKVFDASYLHPPVKPFTVSPLGQASVIAGWNKGLVGMKTGGVRELVIPGRLAYADNPQQAPTFPNDTLIFLVTAQSVTAGK